MESPEKSVQRRGGYFPDPRESAGARRYVCAPVIETVLFLPAAVTDLFRRRCSVVAIALVRHNSSCWDARCV